MTVVPVLEIGGTHASAVLVDTADWTVRARPQAAVVVHGDDSAGVLLDRFAGCVAELGPSDDAPLAVAIPGPFDYDRGVGRFRDVGKFDALNGVHVGAGLADRLPGGRRRIVFVNDATAFGYGAWLASDDARVVALTLGTGIGSAFVAEGVAVTSGPDVPPEGYAYLLSIDGRPLEDVVSRRAIRARFAAAGGNAVLDVREIAGLALLGDDTARAAIVEPVRLLGAAIAPWLRRFRADALVVGGAMSESWSLLGPALRSGLGDVAVPVRRAPDARTATATGAAWHAVGDTTTLRRGGMR